MTRRQRRTYEAVQRVATYIGALIAERPDAAAQALQAPLGRLAESVGRLRQYAEDQDAAQRIGAGDTRRLEAAMRVLRLHHMRPIVHVARTLRPLDESAAKELTLPDSHADATTLVTAAGGMAQAATPHEAFFVQHGLAPDFLARLAMAAQAVQSLMTERATIFGRRNGATSGIRAELRTARSLVDALDALVTPIIESDASRLAAWRSARRIVVSRGAGGGGTEPAAGAIAGSIAGPGTGAGSRQPTPTPVAAA